MDLARLSRTPSRTVLREAWAIGAAVVFLLLGIGVITAATRLMGVNTEGSGDALFVALLILPILVYALASGRLSELRGPGGVGATFREATEASVQPRAIAADTGTVNPEPVEVITKGGVESLEARLHQIKPGGPTVLTMIVGAGYYVRGAVLQYLDRLSQFSGFELVAFINDEQALVASMPARDLRELLLAAGAGEDFIAMVNQGDFERLRRYPGVRDDAVTTRASDAAALRAMTGSDLASILVVDEQRRLVGVVDRDRIVSHMMLALSSAIEPNR